MSYYELPKRIVVHVIADNKIANMMMTAAERYAQEKSDTLDHFRVALQLFPPKVANDQDQLSHRYREELADGMSDYIEDNGFFKPNGHELRRINRADALSGDYVEQVRNRWIRSTTLEVLELTNSYKVVGQTVTV